MYTYKNNKGTFGLYRMQIRMQKGKMREQYFFSSDTPRKGSPCEKPENYEVFEDKKGFPRIKKIRK